MPQCPNSECNAECPPGAKFCNECGTRLPEAAPAGSGGASVAIQDNVITRSQVDASTTNAPASVGGVHINVAPGPAGAPAWVDCACCGRVMERPDYVCPQCREPICQQCYVLDKRTCRRCFGARRPPWELPGSRAGGDIVGPDGGTMVWVPAGESMMGNTDADVEYAAEHLGVDAEWLAGEQPQHRVRLTQGYWLGKCQVTNRQYFEFCAGTGRVFPAESDRGDECPVVSVSWDDAMAYCAHYGLALPTEAQWEYAARGPEGRRYPWGDDWDAQKCSCAGDEPPPGVPAYLEPIPPARVGRHPEDVSWCGVLDLAGNVSEWCADWYDAGHYGRSPASNPPGPPSGQSRVVRGGWWGSDADDCRSANRFSSDPGRRDEANGFRVARTP